MRLNKSLGRFSDKELLDELSERLKAGRKAIETLVGAEKYLVGEKVIHVEYILNKPLREFEDLSRASINYLLNQKRFMPIRIFSDVINRSYKEIRIMRGIGPKRAQEIKNWVAKHGGLLRQEG